MTQHVKGIRFASLALVLASCLAPDLTVGESKRDAGADADAGVDAAIDADQVGGSGGTANGGSGGAEIGGSGAVGGAGIGGTGGAGGNACTLSSGDPTCDDCARTRCEQECSTVTAEPTWNDYLTCLNACWGSEGCGETCNSNYEAAADAAIALVDCARSNCSPECDDVVLGSGGMGGTGGAGASGASGSAGTGAGSGSGGASGAAGSSGASGSAGASGAAGSGGCTGVCFPGEVTDCMCSTVGSTTACCGEQVCNHSCEWGTCSLKPTSQCDWNASATYRCCGSGKWEWCLSSCQWSGNCASCSGCGC